MIKGTFFFIGLMFISLSLVGSTEHFVGRYRHSSPRFSDTLWIIGKKIGENMVAGGR